MASTGARRSSVQKGIELELKVKQFLTKNGYKPISRKKVQGMCGPWELDVFLDTQPPVVIECKNPTAEARSPDGSIRRKAQEAFLTIYDLKNNSNLRSAIFVLITGALPLRTHPRTGHVHDYENFLRTTLGENFHVFGEAELNKLLRIIPQ